MDKFPEYVDVDVKNTMADPTAGEPSSGSRSTETLVGSDAADVKTPINDVKSVLAPANAGTIMEDASTHAAIDEVEDVLNHVASSVPHASAALTSSASQWRVVADEEQDTRANTRLVSSAQQIVEVPDSAPHSRVFPSPYYQYHQPRLGDQYPPFYTGLDRQYGQTNNSSYEHHTGAAGRQVWRDNRGNIYQYVPDDAPPPRPPGHYGDYMNQHSPTQPAYYDPTQSNRLPWFSSNNYPAGQPGNALEHSGPRSTPMNVIAHGSGGNVPRHDPRRGSRDIRLDDPRLYPASSSQDNLESVRFSDLPVPGQLSVPVATAATAAVHPTREAPATARPFRLDPRATPFFPHGWVPNPE